MDLKWLREEIAKNQEDINWLNVLDTVNKIYKEENDKKSFLGISKGFINFVKVSWSHYGTELANEIKQMYPNAIIYQVGTQSKAIKLIKPTKDKPAEVDKKTISDNIIVFISDKSTIETIFNRYKLPFVKYIGAITSKRVMSPDGNKSESKTYYRWRRDGERSIQWGKGQGLSIKRDNLLEELFEEE
jgi:hypothetical protein